MLSGLLKVFLYTHVKVGLEVFGNYSITYYYGCGKELREEVLLVTCAMILIDFDYAEIITSLLCYFDTYDTSPNMSKCLQNNLKNISFKDLQDCTKVMNQCDRIGRFITLWATFQSPWQQLFCQNCQHILGRIVGNWRRFTGLAVMNVLFCLLTKEIITHRDCLIKISLYKLNQRPLYTQTDFH